MKFSQMRKELIKIKYSCPLIDEVIDKIDELGLPKSKTRKIFANLEKIRNINDTLREIADKSTRKLDQIRDEIKEIDQ